MAAPCAFEPWLESRLEALGLDGDVYCGYIRGVLREAECDAERLEGLAGALAAGEQDEDVLQEVCKEIIEKWSEAQDVEISEKKEDEIQAITNIIEKQAQIVVKPKEVLKEDTLQKAALLAQYAEVTDDEDEVNVHEDLGAAAMPIASNKSLFKNTNLEDVMNARKLEREHLRDESQRKKERDKFQREKDKLTKQERKEKEKKRTQKGEKKR
ncbi:coiled-coil domain-containing protein 43 isoform X1 [Protobothrops mucrosquamatus]|uniref:coiled-coil domain-containing protein 43 isoform X1 n=1 Tax=Protobothrops mucrosquamatus TaxID=103944 RepID=UPI000775ABFD|nr:coiled-coil domain-containing protein 43 isoform X1 [Protobothrops mucrosquamatus]